MCCTRTSYYISQATPVPFIFQLELWRKCPIYYTLYMVVGHVRSFITRTSAVWTCGTSHWSRLNRISQNVCTANQNVSSANLFQREQCVVFSHKCLWECAFAALILVKMRHRMLVKCLLQEWQEAVLNVNKTRREKSAATGTSNSPEDRWVLLLHWL